MVLSYSQDPIRMIDPEWKDTRRWGSTKATLLVSLSFFEVLLQWCMVLNFYLMEFIGLLVFQLDHDVLCCKTLERPGAVT